ncbi:hypothetical protein B0F90DRAFT_131037 [Multifurca ochricompacta]|uniref:Uncharacterized protein n=1 Tax=Multifurca ochricompacta TaxID=376703 RepID=A0AAD4MD43_9AGAM|nr:hypothetical protein B0F90DRAFT_131037 [Multifurca ochricompacta]
MAPSYKTSTYAPYFPYGASTAPPVTTYQPVQRASTPLVSAVASETPITPALINRVNDAASTDPILANFLQLAASGRATSDQLKTLALLIQSLASAPSSSMPSALGSVSSSESHSVPNQLSQTPTSIPSPSTPATLQSSHANSYDHPSSVQPTASAGLGAPKDFDLVLEFPERPYDRWLVPRVPVVCERTPSIGNIEAILLLFALPFPKQKATEPESAEPAGTDPPQEVVQFRITKVHQAFGTAFSIGSADSQKWRQTAASLERSFVSRVVLLLMFGDISIDVLVGCSRTGVSPTPTLGRRLAHKVADGRDTLCHEVNQACSWRSKFREAQSHAQRLGSTVDSQGVVISPKRKRASQPKAGSASKKIACVSCGQTDVPLMMGGRFCRQCVDAGKTERAIISCCDQQANCRVDCTITCFALTMGTNPPLVAEESINLVSATLPDPPTVAP